MTSPLTYPFPNPKGTLEQFGLHPKRSFGQNFLSDPRLVDRIAGLCPAGAFAVEIGAGLGGLTVQLLNRGHTVFAIERDRDMLPVLTALLQGALESGALLLCEADAKTVDYSAILASHPSPRVLMGNLPYNLTGPLLQRATQCAQQMDLAVFLVQLEVAERLTASPGSKIYGGLSVFAQNAFKVRKEFVVKRGAFYPQPQVESAVVTLTPREVSYSEETPTFRALVNGAFQKRRKTLRNAWAGVGALSGDSLAQIATSADICLDDRGETLVVEQFARMALAVDTHIAQKPSE